MKLDGIQVLRGIAALAVALFHFHAVETLYGPDQLTPALFEYGRIGVDLFFVISGAIMFHVAGSAAPSPGASSRFLLRRALRIYPPWWAACGLVVAVWMLSGRTLFDGITGPAPDLPASFALWPTAQEPALGVGWTLIHEMYFYLMFALLLLAPVRWRAPLMALWAAIILSVWLTGARDSLAPPLAVAASPLTLEFILGASVMSIRTRISAKVQPWLAPAGVLLLIAPVILHGPSPDPALFEDHMRRAVSFGPGAALLLLAMVSGPAATRNWPPAGIALGDWSYALYLVHVPVFAVLGALWARFAGPGLTDNVAALAVFTATAIAAAAVFYHAVERPPQRLMPRRS